ncbi:tetracycline resistance protein, class E-like isoform X2 [Colletes gigas]|uniref:tetracycline resistance protein, class E-like isoform X2 n=1 Tax=Colletes gigas TaxID=935657 RepID=UPI001C9A921F|nr:tetracycline resistance protein, class E-like isoform X2 [Colletes gigas]
MEQIVTGWRRYALVQPSLMVLIFAQAISSNILTDLIVYRVCKITLGKNKTECMLLHENSSCAEALQIDLQVQPEVTLSSLFDLNLVKELISTCTKKRDGFNRKIVWCCLTTIILLVTVMQGEMTIGYLFTNARLGWDVNKYSIYTATNILLKTFGLIFGVKILTVYAGLSEKMAAILSLLSSISSSLVQSFTWKSWHMYLSVVVGVFSGVTNPMLRTILSKSVPPENTGKIFSLTISIETLTPLIAASLYGMIYSRFMPPLYPLPVWLVSVGIYIIAIFVLLNIRVQDKNTLRYAPLTQNSELLS